MVNEPIPFDFPCDGVNVILERLHHFCERIVLFARARISSSTICFRFGFRFTFMFIYAISFYISVYISVYISLYISLYVSLYVNG